MKMQAVNMYIFYVFPLTVTLYTEVWCIMRPESASLSDIGRFKDYIENFEPLTAYNKISELQKRQRKNLTTRQYVDMFMDLTDSTDELLKLKVQDGDTRIMMRRDGRRWKPPKGLFLHDKDRFSLRPRLFELMKQSIYQARNKMIVMQVIRQKYYVKSRTNRVKLYKMGFLMRKTDEYVRIFAKFNYQGIRTCGTVRQNVPYYMRLYDLLLIQERLLNLWFTVELLADLIVLNDNELKHTVEDHNEKRLDYWDFED